MKDVFMCAIVFLFLSSICSAQSTINTYQVLTLRVYDQNDKVLHKEVLENEAAANFDIPAYIREKKEETRITIKGDYRSDHELNVVRFDTRSLEDKEQRELVCPITTSSVKPFIGVAATSMEDFNGVLIERVVEGSPADLAGLEAGQVLMNLHDTEIRSMCDLKIAVSLCEVGELVDVVLEDGGKMIDSNITIGGQVKNTITYEACSNEIPPLEINDSKIEIVSSELNVYPNPTRGETTLKFNSNSEGDLKLYLIDTNGSILVNKVINDFSGSYHTTHSFETLAAGTYFFLIEQDGALFKETVINLKD